MGEVLELRDDEWTRVNVAERHKNFVIIDRRTISKYSEIAENPAPIFSRGADPGHPALSSFPLPVAPIEPDRD
jgi:hypothetical protein